MWWQRTNAYRVTSDISVNISAASRINGMRIAASVASLALNIMAVMNIIALGALSA